MQKLIDLGFVEVQTGGGCLALLRYRDGKTDVLTDTDGLSLPSDDDWLLVTYSGDWMNDEDSEQLEMIGSGDAGCMIETAQAQLGFASVKVGRRSVKFTTCAAASALYRATIERLDVGASKAPCCTLLDAAGTVVGRVSYNGRVWSGAEYHPDERALYNPPAGSR